jgi:hypothetical protein
MKIVVSIVVWLSVSAPCIGLFLPWAYLDMQEPSVIKQLRSSGVLGESFGELTKEVGRVTATVRRGAKTITGDLADVGQIPTQVTGIQIPSMVRQQNAQVAIALLELLTKQRQQLELKSLAVFLVPGLAVLLGLLILGPVGKPPAVWLIAALCSAVAAAGWWRLATLNPKTLVIAITIGPGLWLSLGGYGGLALAATIRGLVKGARA